ncbi:hypothetical protein B9Z65_8875 [Elsinoe australis]|uniref:Uncharacterized protein n=1 Tax=Elsinoe australis TaxID=40998 RepID=A0A2P7YF02_9PEZI|nr:hypothetical protein B9Z65_8875 [Elsinoe australis]
MSSQQKLSSFKAIGFDVMGTLLDERVGIYEAFSPIHQYLQSSQTPNTVQKGYNEALSYHMRNSPPGTSYQNIMIQAHRRVSEELSHGQYVPSREESLVFSKALADWPAWWDTVQALQTLAEDSKLVLVSNMDTEVLEKIVSTGALREVRFAALIGSDKSRAFKPDQQVNQTLLDTVKNDFGISKDRVLLVAQGTGSDHIPARDMGIASAWIDRYDQGQDVLEELGLKPAWTFKSLKELVEQRVRTEDR